MSLALRVAREDDLDRLLDIHTSAFPDPRGREARLRNFTANPLGQLDDLRVVVDGARLLAHAFLFRLEAWFGGVRAPVGGLATVGVAPEARGRGVGTWLVEELCARAAARGDALAVLYAYRQGFYARARFATTSAYRRLRLHPASIPYEPEMGVRVASGRDREAMQACREAQARRHTGMLARSARAWDARLSAERRTWLLAEREGGEGGVEGYVAWSLEQEEPHGATTLLVDEMAARTDAAAHTLWGLVRAQRDQVAEVRVDVAADDPIDRALVDADRARSGDAQVEHVLGELAAGPMVRVLDAPRALAARGWCADGRLVLEVDGAPLALEVHGGRASCVPTTDEPAVRLDGRALAAVAFGGLRAADAARLGWLEARDPDALARVDALLELPAYFSPDPF